MHDDFALVLLISLYIPLCVNASVSKFDLWWEFHWHKFLIIKQKLKAALQFPGVSGTFIFFFFNQNIYSNASTPYLFNECCASFESKNCSFIFIFSFAPRCYHQILCLAYSWIYGELNTIYFALGWNARAWRKTHPLTDDKRMFVYLLNKFNALIRMYRSGAHIKLNCVVECNNINLMCISGAHLLVDDIGAMENSIHVFKFKVIALFKITCSEQVSWLTLCGVNSEWKPWIELWDWHQMCLH